MVPGTGVSIMNKPGEGVVVSCPQPNGSLINKPLYHCGFLLGWRTFMVP